MKGGLKPALVREHQGATEQSSLRLVVKVDSSAHSRVKIDVL